MNSKSKGHWSKLLVFQKEKATTILVNAQRKAILCWGQKVGELFHWIPVEFKTEEAAQQFLSDGSTLVELKREIGAPVEWRTELLGPVPPPEVPMHEGVTPHLLAGAPSVQASGTPSSSAQE